MINETKENVGNSSTNNLTLDVNLLLESFLVDVTGVYLMSFSTIANEVREVFRQNGARCKSIAQRIKLDNVFHRSLMAHEKMNLIQFQTVLIHKLPAFDLDTENTSEASQRKNLEQHRKQLAYYFKKANKRLFNYIYNSPYYDTQELYSYITKNYKHLNDADKFQLIEIAQYFYFILHDLSNNNYKLTDLFDVEVLNSILPQTFPRTFIDDFLGNQCHLSNESEHKVLAIYKELTGQDWGKKKEILVSDMLEQILSNTTKTFFAKNKLRLNRDISEFLEEISLNSPTYLYSLNKIPFVLSDLSLEKVTKTSTLTFKEFTVLYLLAKDKITLRNKDTSQEDLLNIITLLLMTFGINKAYKQLEQQYIETLYTVEELSISAHSKELETYRNQLEEVSNNFEQQILTLQKSFAAQENQLTNRINDLTDNNSIKDKEIERLKAQNALLQEENSLVQSLSSALFSQQLAEEEQRSTVDETAIGKLSLKISEKRVVLVGGHAKFQQKFAATFPSVYVIPVDEASIGETQVRNADIVIFITSYNNHGQFYRLKKCINHHQKVIFLNHQSGAIEIMAQQILNQL